MTTAAHLTEASFWHIFEQLDIGYHDPCWVVRADDLLIPDRSINQPLHDFVDRVGELLPHVPEADGLPVGTAFCRIVDAGRPQHMRWHIDNEETGVRFTTAVSTDDHPVNMAFTTDRARVGQLTEYGEPHQRWPNGQITKYTDDIHGVIHPPKRPGERTAVFFVTMYPNREVADLYTSNANPAGHDALPRLEATRRP